MKMNLNWQCANNIVKNREESDLSNASPECRPHNGPIYSAMQAKGFDRGASAQRKEIASD